MTITNMFNGFFAYQPIHLQEIAESCKRSHLNTFWKVLAALAFFFSPEDPAEGLKEGTIVFEFEKALTYHICVINGILEPKN